MENWRWMTSTCLWAEYHHIVTNHVHSAWCIGRSEIVNTGLHLLNRRHNQRQLYCELRNFESLESSPRNCAQNVAKSKPGDLPRLLTVEWGRPPGFSNSANSQRFCSCRTGPIKARSAVIVGRRMKEYERSLCSGSSANVMLSCYIRPSSWQSRSQSMGLGIDPRCRSLTRLSLPELSDLK